MKKYMMAAAGLIAALSMASCKKEIKGIDAPEFGQDGKELAQLTLRIAGAPTTKATDPLLYNKEDMLKTIEVFVFDEVDGSATYRLLQAYKAAEAADINEAGNGATIKFNTSTGKKHIYVVANAKNNGGSPLAETVVSEADLLSAISQYNENGAQDFVMVGSAKQAESFEPVLVAGKAAANILSVQLKRIMARVKIDEIQGAFESPAMQAQDFKISRIFLMNAPKQAKLVNGRWEDVFGVAAASDLNANSAIADAASFPKVEVTDEGYQDAFTSFVAAAAVGKYYVYAAPAANGTDANGLWNWMDASAWVPGTSSVATPSDAVVAGLTFKSYSANNILYAASGTPNTGNKMTEAQLSNPYFYVYPNSSTPTASYTQVDQTTKLVIEAVYGSGATATTVFYPISIGWVQPNYAYEIKKVTIKNLGSVDPFHPVTSAQLTLNITVRDWDSGNIVGEFNNEDGDGTRDEFTM